MQTHVGSLTEMTTTSIPLLQKNKQVLKGIRLGEREILTGNMNQAFFGRLLENYL
jgi:hypothetical protein